MEVEQQLGELVPGWVTVWHVLMFHVDVSIDLLVDVLDGTKVETSD